MKDIQKAVIKKDGKFLILLRSSDSSHFPEHWDFPGGKIEDKEEPYDAVEREVREETSLKVKAVSIIAHYEFVAYSEQIRFTIFETEIVSGGVEVSEEHTDYKWAKKEDILKLKTEPYIPAYFNEF